MALKALEAPEAMPLMQFHAGIWYYCADSAAKSSKKFLDALADSRDN